MGVAPFVTDSTWVCAHALECIVIYIYIPDTDLYSDPGCAAAHWNIMDSSLVHVSQFCPHFLNNLQPNNPTNTSKNLFSGCDHFAQS